MDPTRGAPARTFHDELDALERVRSSQVRERLARAQAIAATAERAGDDAARMRARLLMADMLHRLGEGAEAARLAVEVHAWAEASRATSLLRRSHLVLTSVFTGIGDASSALDHAVRGVDLLDDDVAPRERANQLLCLADALAIVGSVAEARRRYDEARSLFATIGDGERELNVLNNLIVLEWESGDAEAAARGADELLARSLERDEMNPSYADTIARARMAAGDFAGALDAVTDGLTLLDEQGDTQAVTPAELMLTEAEVLLALGRPVDADAAARRCLEVCRQRDLGALRVDALRVQAEVLAALGDFRAAYEAHRRFHAEGVALRGRQQEAAARTRHALFETAEARRDAQRFWRQARTDPLTELYNRRFVDETLPRYLAAVADDPDASLVAAIVDIDHFKAINDRYTHAVGDRVLVQLAELLRIEAHDDGAAGSDRPGYAARLGGEEFVIVRTRPTVDPVDALDGLRARVAAFDWATIAPELRLTLSIGVAVAGPLDTQFTLLSRADEHLYAAKAAGRDRVLGDRVDA